MGAGLRGHTASPPLHWPRNHEDGPGFKGCRRAREWMQPLSGKTAHCRLLTDHMHLSNGHKKLGQARVSYLSGSPSVRRTPEHGRPQSEPLPVLASLSARTCRHGPEGLWSRQLVGSWGGGNTVTVAPSHPETSTPDSLSWGPEAGASTPHAAVHRNSHLPFITANSCRVATTAPPAHSTQHTCLLVHRARR